MSSGDFIFYLWPDYVNSQFLLADSASYLDFLFSVSKYVLWVSLMQFPGEDILRCDAKVAVGLFIKRAWPGLPTSINTRLKGLVLSRKTGVAMLCGPTGSATTLTRTWISRWPTPNSWQRSFTVAAKSNVWCRAAGPKSFASLSFNAAFASLGKLGGGLLSYFLTHPEASSKPQRKPRPNPVCSSRFV
jgi:hypothetical protein